MSKTWQNNHNVTCDECLYAEHIAHWVDGLPFRCDLKCLLGYETDYHVPYEKYWNCEYFVKYNVFKRIWFKLKKRWDVILNE